jgi:hypothetical protein
MPVSVRRQLNELPDDTKVNIEFYRDLPTRCSGRGTVALRLSIEPPASSRQLARRFRCKTAVHAPSVNGCQDPQKNGGETCW